MRYLFIVLMLLSGSSVMAQSVQYDTLRDAENSYLVYRGMFTFADLQQQPEFKWMAAGAAAYQPKVASMEKLKTSLKDCTLLVFMGTWCSDSRDLVPRLYTVLQQAGYPVKNVQLYGMDRPKQSGTGAEANWKVSLVPTIIVLRKGAELGRITENVQRSIEEDLAEIAAH